MSLHIGTANSRRRTDILVARENFQRALDDQMKWCISGDCSETNWGGSDRLHWRGEACPPANPAMLKRIIERCERDLATLPVSRRSI